MKMSNKLTTTTLPIDEILRGIRAGRSLLQIEKALGVSAVDFLELTAADESVNLRYKQAQTISAFSIGAELMELARKNYEEPASAVKNNALKLYMDVLQKEMDSRNPAVYSGKAPINVSVPIQITTSLDMGGPKQLEGVYELKAEHVTELETEKLSISAGPAAGSEPGGVVGAGAEDSSSAEAPNPFRALFAPEEIQEGGPGPGAAGDSRPAKVGARKPRRAAAARNDSASPLPSAPSGGAGTGAPQEQASNAPEEGQC